MYLVQTFFTNPNFAFVINNIFGLPRELFCLETRNHLYVNYFLIILLC